MVELKDFIKETLVQISEGVMGAQQALHDKDVIISPHEVQEHRGGGGKHLLGKKSESLSPAFREVQHIEFNVAITVVNKEGDKAGFGVFAAFASGGSVVASEAVNQNVSTIKFSVPISLPATYYQYVDSPSGGQWSKYKKVLD